MAKDKIEMNLLIEAQRATFRQIHSRFEERHRAPDEGSRVSWRAVLGALGVVAAGLAWGAS